MDIESFRPESKIKFDKKSLQDPKIIGLISFLVGLFIGLVILGWWLFPVDWENASISDLRPDLQEDYLRLAIDSYNLRQDDEAAQRRLAEFGEGLDSLISRVATNPGDQSEDTITLFQAQLSLGDEIPQLIAGEELQEQLAAEDGALLDTQSLLLTMCGITLVLGIALGVIYYIRRRRSDAGLGLGSQKDSEPFDSSGIDLDSLGEAAPLSQWMTTYLVGDDLFDDSFSIDSPAGEFLGECGIGIAETIGVGDPKRVSAFELWLFDKNDIQTVTKVLMSNHTFRDDSARDRLSAKGEPVLTEPGAETVLETETLQLVVRVVDMDYGEGALPDESFFERATIELAVWSKT